MWALVPKKQLLYYSKKQLLCFACLACLLGVRACLLGLLACLACLLACVLACLFAWLACLHGLFGPFVALAVQGPGVPDRGVMEDEKEREENKWADLRLKSNNTTLNGGEKQTAQAMQGA